MYEEIAWVEKYFREVDRKKRREILDEAIQAEGMSPDNELRLKLWESRYGKKNSADVDYFIRGWMTFYYLQATAKSMFKKKKIAKDLDAIRSDWKFALAGEYGEIGQEVLYQELCNMTRLYIHLCQTDRTYNAVLFGLGRIKEDTQAGKVARDIYQLAYEIPQQTGTEEEFRIFTKAATDTFYEVYENQQNLLRDRIRG